MHEVRPFFRLLIVDENLRLVQETGKALLDPELLCGGSRVILATGTPAIKDSAPVVEIAHMLHHGRNRLGFLMVAFADQSIIHIHVDIKWFLHTPDSRAGLISDGAGEHPFRSSTTMMSHERIH